MGDGGRRPSCGNVLENKEHARRWPTPILITVMFEWRVLYNVYCCCRRGTTQFALLYVQFMISLAFQRKPTVFRGRVWGSVFALPGLFSIFSSIACLPLTFVCASTPLTSTMYACGLAHLLLLNCDIVDDLRFVLFSALWQNSLFSRLCWSFVRCDYCMWWFGILRFERG